MDSEEKIKTLENLGDFVVRDVGTSFIAILVPPRMEADSWTGPFFTSDVDKDKAINSLHDMIEEQVWLWVEKL